MSDCESLFSEENQIYRDIISELKKVPQKVSIGYDKQRSDASIA
jgi:hypothetical protein